jgi:hypothetical protein
MIRARVAEQFTAIRELLPACDSPASRSLPRASTLVDHFRGAPHVDAYANIAAKS